MNWFEWAEKHLSNLKESQATASSLFAKIYTPRAQKVLQLASAEAKRRNHNFLGTEHLLLGLIELKQGAASNVLQKLGLNLEAVRLEVERLAPNSTNQEVIGTPYTPRVKKILMLAQKDAKALNHTYIGTEHLLLGLLAENDGVAAKIFKKFNLNQEQIRKGILREPTPQFPSDDNQQKGN